jgi:tetratricopeptide (TPR) repeat protein
MADSVTIGPGLGYEVTAVTAQMVSGGRGSASARSWPAQQPVLSGRLPPLVSPYAPRQETGLSLVNLPPGQVTVLATADDAAFQRGPGAGGTGKTYLAASLARAHLDARAARLVVWIAAASQDAVIRGYARALRDVGAANQAEGDERAAARFVEWLASTDVPWLVVLDDLNDLTAIEDWWPGGAAGHVLVTTERPDICQRYNPRFVRVGGFSPREALWYLSERLRADHDQRTGATDLAIELGFLPLALAQAAAVMSGTGLSCRRYLALVAERKPKPGGGPAAVHPAAAATYSLSAQFAHELPPVGLASRALSLISMLGPYGIPAAVLTCRAARTYLAGGGAFPIDRNQAWTAVENLATAGLVMIEADSAARTVLAHSLVQAQARQSLPAAEREAAVRASADALTETWSGQNATPDLAASLRDCAARLREVGGATLWTPQCHPLLLQVGESLTSSGLTGQAVAYWRTMLSISERHLGAGHAQTARFRDLLGAAYEMSGRTDEAVAMYEALLSYLEKTEAGCHPGILAARSSLARCYLAADRGSDALQLTSRTVTECEQLLGVNHPDTLAARTGLAESYLAAGQFKQAVDLCKRALTDRERRQGADHPDTIAARASLATAYRSAGKLKDAIKQYERTLADRERVQGAADPDTITARRDLAFAACLAEKYSYSVKQYERAVADSQQVFGPGHPLTTGLQEDLDAVASQGLASLGIDLRTRQPR